MRELEKLRVTETDIDSQRKVKRKRGGGLKKELLVEETERDGGKSVKERGR